MADPASLAFGITGVVGTVIQVYTAVAAAYDVYLNVKDFPSTYTNLRMALFMERQRLEIFHDTVLLSITEEEKRRIQNSPKDRAYWKVVEWIFNQILETFERSNQKAEQYGQHMEQTEKHDDSDEDLIRRITLSAKLTPRRNISNLARTLKFVFRDKKSMEQTAKQLRDWNDSLNSITTPLIQESTRRQLRTRLSTNDTQRLHMLQAAAKFLEHWDIESMASARTVIEQSYRSEEQEFAEVEDLALSATSAATDDESDQRLEMRSLKFSGNPFPTDRVRATGWYEEKSVIVDWRCCQDDSWRRSDPKAFRQRTENLTRVLNNDLRPLGLPILPCVGYFDQTTTITGYAFRPPPEALPGQKPSTLQNVFERTKKADDVPELGDRMELAKTLASAVFEIHNLGWMHKNLQPVNILFWPKAGPREEPSLRQPYLMGFDISRPNRPGEVTEKPPFRPEDDRYRHPSYKDRDALSFQPSFDVYSLGVMLWEIGVWRELDPSVALQRQRPGSPIVPADPRLVEKLIARGSINELKRMTGAHYYDAVTACLSGEFDAFWQNETVDSEARLRAYLDVLRKKVIDALAFCGA